MPRVDVEECLEARLHLTSDEGGRLVGAYYTIATRKSKALRTDPDAEAGQVDNLRYENGHLVTEYSSYFGDDSEARQACGYAEWLQRALASLRARMLEDLCFQHRKKELDQIERHVVRDYIVRFGLAEVFYSNLDVWKLANERPGDEERDRLAQEKRALDALRRALARPGFETTWASPAPREDVSAAEARLGIKLSPSYRRFLEQHDGLSAKHDGRVVMELFPAARLERTEVRLFEATRTRKQSLVLCGRLDLVPKGPSDGEIAFNPRLKYEAGEHQFGPLCRNEKEQRSYLSPRANFSETLTFIAKVFARK